MQVKHVYAIDSFGTPGGFTDCLYRGEDGQPTSARLPGAHTAQTAWAIIKRLREADINRRTPSA